MLAASLILSVTYLLTIVAVVYKCALGLWDIIINNNINIVKQHIFEHDNT